MHQGVFRVSEVFGFRACLRLMVSQCYAFQGQGQGCLVQVSQGLALEPVLGSGVSQGFGENSYISLQFGT